jgi:hypothetical protein
MPCPAFVWVKRVTGKSCSSSTAGLRPKKDRTCRQPIQRLGGSREGKSLEVYWQGRDRERQRERARARERGEREERESERLRERRDFIDNQQVTEIRSEREREREREREKFIDNQIDD